MRRGHGRDQRTRIGVARVVQDVVGAALLDDAPQIHDCDRVCEIIDEREVVGDEQIGQPALGLQVGEQIQDLRLHRDIKRTGGLIQDQQARRHGKCARDRDALPLSARKRMRITIHHGGRQTHFLEQGTDARALRAGDDALLHTARVPETVAAVRAEGARRGLSERESARLVSETLAEIVAQVIGRTGLNRLLVAGGETSNAVSQRLGIDGLRIWREIQPGLPSCLSLGDAPLLLVLKSGSFGSPEFFAQAIDHLKAQ